MVEPRQEGREGVGAADGFTAASTRGGGATGAQVLVALFRDASGVVGRVIRWQTRSRYSHAALVFRQDGQDGKKDQPEVIEAREFEGVRITDGIVGGAAVVDLFRVELSAVQLFEVRSFAFGQIGKGYDYTMVARFISRRQASRRTSGKWFCSELVFAALQKAGVNLLERTEPWEVSPGMLARSPLLTLAGTLPAYSTAGEGFTAETQRAQRLEELERRYL